MDKYRRAKKRKNQKTSRSSVIGILFLVLVLVGLIAACVVLSTSADRKDPSPARDSESVPSEETTGITGGEDTETKPPIVTSGEDLPVLEPVYSIPEEFYSDAALCIRRSDGKAIIALNEDERRYPASLTKIMTVIVALEVIDDWDETVTLPTEMFAMLLKANASVAGFTEGEKVKAWDLVHAALVPSGADGSLGLAFIVSGSEEEFVKLMNEKAIEIGMTSTYFANATGLHDENTYSTARDLVTLFEYAVNNPTFREIIAKSSYTTASTNKHPGGLTMSSTVYTAFRSVTPDYDYILGGKTGYTEEAGQTLATLASIDGEEYILVTLGAGDGEQKPKYNAIDAVAVYDMIREANKQAGITGKTGKDA